MGNFVARTYDSFGNRRGNGYQNNSQHEMSVLFNIGYRTFDTAFDINENPKV